MHIEMIAIGTELLSGRIQDRNTQLLGTHLNTLNLELYKSHIISDRPEYITTTLMEAWDTSDIVIMSGGMGPTADDKTKETVAKFFGKEISFSEEANKLAKEQYERIGKDFQENGYSLQPKDFQPVPNTMGLAPGLVYFDEKAKKALFVFPGVPREFSAMVEKTLIPFMRKHFQINQSFKGHATIRTKGIAEEQIFFELCPELWDELALFGSVASLPQTLGVDIHVHLETTNEEEFEQKKEIIYKTVRKTPLLPYIWCTDQKSLGQAVIDMAKEKKVKIAFAESCTGGFNSSRITDIDGASEVYVGSVTSYSNKAKETLLNVKSETLEKFGAVSEETAREMAEGAKLALDADIVVSTTGITGPTGGSDEKPIGTCAFGLTSPRGTQSLMKYFKGDRRSLKKRFSEMALFTLLEELENL